MSSPILTGINRSREYETMHYIVAGGTGFVGQYLIKRWLEREIQVTVISRDTTKIQRIFQDRVRAVSWPEFGEQSVHFLPHSRLLLNLAGASIGDKAWSNPRKRDILSSRLQTTIELSSLCAALGDKSPPFFCASGIGVYGTQKEENTPLLPPAFNEDTPIHFDVYPDFISQVAREWECATNTAKAHGVRTVNLRFGVALGQGGVLQKLKCPFQLGLGPVLGSGHQAFSWIHIADLAEIIDFILHHTTLAGAVNVTSPHTVTQQDFARAYAKALHRPCFLKIPAYLLKILFGEMAEELLLKGQHVFPKRLIDAGYVFQYPRIETALSNIVKSG